MESWIGYLLLFAVGLVAGVINVIAGGGSFLTLPVLMFLGLPAGVANGTNRLGVMIQNIGAVWSFEREKLIDWRSLLWAALPATAGAIVGAQLALVVSDEAFKRILALLMVGIALWTFWSSRKTPVPYTPEKAPRLLFLMPTFFLIGIYGGFVQAGIGFLILAATSATGLDLIRGNAIKLLAILCLTTVALAIFAWHGKVVWPAGIALGAGTVIGALAGVRMQILKGHQWVRSVVTVTIIVFAVKLWFWP